MFNPMPNT